VVREAELAPVEVGAAWAVTVGFPEEVVRPAERLDALVAGTAGARRDGAAVEQGEKRLQLVPLGVVDGVPGGHRQPQRRPGGGAAQRVDRAQHGIDRVRGERLLRALDRDDLRVPGVGEVAVEELEAGRRLDVGELDIGQVNQAQQRPARGGRHGRGPGSGVTLRPGTGHAEIVAYDMRFAVHHRDRAVHSGGARPQHLART
jgi:hypothetical protein